MVESLWHVFVDCDYARNCCKSIGLWDDIDALCNSVDDAQELFIRIVEEFNKDHVESDCDYVGLVEKSKSCCLGGKSGNLCSNDSQRCMGSYGVEGCSHVQGGFSWERGKMA